MSMTAEHGSEARVRLGGSAVAAEGEPGVSVLPRGPQRGQSARRRSVGAAILALAVPLAVVFLGLRAFSMPTTTFHVDAASCPVIGSGTPADPFCTLQDAICAAAAGDDITVAPGTYPEAIRMRPGVSVISQGGPAVTTIDATGQPCSDSDFCTKRAGTQCSVVTFSSGHTPATILDGFTLTGGAGLIQSTKVAGGGIFVFSSPTITNNVITNNLLAGPHPDFFGAGIYVGVGDPIITGNVISGNTAVPAAGVSTALTFGYGGGIWVSSFASATITDNVVSGNQAGDSALAYSIGAGGGIVIFPGPATLPGTVVDRNIIADNVTDSFGGGLCLLSPPGSDLLTVVTNNVISGNTGRNGGGIYTYFNMSNSINNTITDNEAMLGGGVFTGPSDTTLPVTITNNIIESNRVRMFGTGGGIYTIDGSATFDPTIEFNDLWGNDKNEVAGDRIDADTIGVGGNFSADPLFVNRLLADFHLDPNSPAIDTALATVAPPVDLDSTTRGFDGDGVPDSPQPGDVDVGAFEFGAGCVPATEVCDGVDNDCNGLTDEGFVDTDGDLMADCVDPDDDNDGVPDENDCAPLDTSAFAPATEVTGLTVLGLSPTAIDFAFQDIGSGTTYEVISGLATRLRAAGGFGENFCVAQDVLLAPWQDTRPAPPVGDAWYYAVRATNACGNGPFDHLTLDQPRAAEVCPDGIIDLDGDGSPSDLDCDDADGLNAPILAEICDGRDNNCDGIIDNSLIDTDGDGLQDCIDLDDDNDGALDTGDCAPLDPTAFGLPGPLDDLAVLDTLPTQIAWTDQALGSGTTYTLVTGSIVATGAVDFPAGTCLIRVTASPASDTRPSPATGVVRYYLARPENVCGIATYGSPDRDGSPPCP